MLVEHPTTRATRLWRIGGSLVAVALLGFGGLQVVERLAHEQETIVTELDGSGVQAVDVDYDFGNDGSVRIVGTNTDTIRVTARIDHGLRDTGHSERVEGDRLVVRASCPVLLSQFCEVDYDIEVPQDVMVRVSVTDGKATVRGVTGDVEASTGDGRIELAGAQGDLRVSSGDGSVVATDLSSRVVEASTGDGSVELGFAASPRTVDVSSGDGSVEVVLPNGPIDRDVRYRVDSSSGDGAVDTSIRTDPESDRAVTARTGDGNVTIRYPSG